MGVQTRLVRAGKCGGGQVARESYHDAGPHVLVLISPGQWWSRRSCGFAFAETIRLPERVDVVGRDGAVEEFELIIGQFTVRAAGEGPR